MTLQDELAPEAMALADHHCHGLVRGELDAAGVDALLSEGGAAPPGTSNFDTPLGLAVRRHCAPLLDLPAHAPAADYLARRAELGADEVARRLLRASGTGTFLVDTGFRAGRADRPGRAGRAGRPGGGAPDRPAGGGGRPAGRHRGGAGRVRRPRSPPRWPPSWPRPARSA